jgi:hypothetical protein
MRLQAGVSMLARRAEPEGIMSEYKSDLLRLLDERGHIHQVTDPVALDALARPTPPEDLQQPVDQESDDPEIDAVLPSQLADHLKHSYLSAPGTPKRNASAT